MRYLVKRRCSTRRSLDPAAPQFDEWVNLQRGKTVSARRLPAHAPIDEWIASGHLAPVEEQRA